MYSYVGVGPRLHSIITLFWPILVNNPFGLLFRLQAEIAIFGTTSFGVGRYSFGKYLDSLVMPHFTS